MGNFCNNVLFESTNQDEFNFGNDGTQEHNFNTFYGGSQLFVNSTVGINFKYNIFCDADVEITTTTDLQYSLFYTKVS